MMKCSDLLMMEHSQRRKMTKKKPKNNVSETLHSLATDMHMAGMLSDEQMSAFDVRFLAPIEPMKAKQIK